LRSLKEQEQSSWQEGQVKWSSYVLGAVAKFAQKARLPEDFSFCAVVGEQGHPFGKQASSAWVMHFHTSVFNF
jgi:hypothetical protein